MIPVQHTILYLSNIVRKEKLQLEMLEQLEIFQIFIQNFIIYFRYRLIAMAIV